MTDVKQLPRINWPNGPGDYKVVQLYIEGRPYLRFAEKEIGTNHASVIRTLAEELGRSYTEVTGFISQTIPAPKTKWYRVAGMGIKVSHKR